MAFLGSSSISLDATVGAVRVTGSSYAPGLSVTDSKCMLSHSSTYAHIQEYVFPGDNCTSLIPTGTGIFQTGVKLEFPTSTPTNVHVIQDEFEHAEGFLAISDADLGLEYYIVTYCTMGGVCQFTVTPISNTTSVTIYFPETVQTDSICISGISGLDVVPGIGLPFTLDELEVLHIESESDLSGTYITADKKVAVFAGARDVPSKKNGYKSRLLEQLPPVNKWDQDFIFSPNPLNDEGDILKLVTMIDNTEIFITGFSPFVIPDSGSKVERRIDWGMPSVVTASNPVLAMQVMAVTLYDDDVNATDIPMPAMVLVPGFNHWTSDTLYFPCVYLSGQITSTSLVSVSAVNGTTTSMSTGTVAHVGNTGYITDTLNAPSEVITIYGFLAAYGYCHGASAFLLDIDWSTEIEVTF